MRLRHSVKAGDAGSTLETLEPSLIELQKKIEILQAMEMLGIAGPEMLGPSDKDIS